MHIGKITMETAYRTALSSDNEFKLASFVQIP